MSEPTNSPLPSAGAINGDKLSGQLIIKAQLGDDIRKMMIHNEDLTLNELVLMMERIFAGKISNSDELTIKYLDEDGDKITLLNDSDLTVALHFHKLLRLFVFVNGQEQINNTTANVKQEENVIDAKEFRNELKDIRNSVQTILDRLQLSSTNDGSTTTVLPITTKPEFEPLKQLNPPRSATPENNQSNVNHVANHEYPSASTKMVDTQPIPSTDLTQTPSNQFQSIATPHFASSGYSQEEQAKANLFGPPPTAFPGIPTPSNPVAPRFPPVTTSTSSALPSAFSSTPTPPPLSTSSTAGFLGQSVASPQQGGFYGQQQQTMAATAPPPPVGGFYGQQQASIAGNFNPTNTYPPQQPSPSPSNSSPATINPSFSQAVPPPMAFQQPYGTYSPQNAYYNPVQPYSK